MYGWSWMMPECVCGCRLCVRLTKSSIILPIKFLHTTKRLPLRSLCAGVCEGHCLEYNRHVTGLHPPSLEPTAGHPGRTGGGLPVRHTKFPSANESVRGGVVTEWEESPCSVFGFFSLGPEVGQPTASPPLWGWTFSSRHNFCPGPTAVTAIE